MKRYTLHMVTDTGMTAVRFAELDQAISALAPEAWDYWIEDSYTGRRVADMYNNPVNR